jgi:hypothetical protein
MKLKVTLMLLLALTVTACQKNERTATTPMTGVYGAAMISGEVEMADGSSPAGVEVTLRGTGMTTVLAADGRFAFGSVPAEGELAFRRASDGVDAALRVGSASGHMTIELAKSDARRSGRRRGVGRGEKVREIEGLVVSADAAQLVVFSSKKEEVTVALAAGTVIRHGGTILSAADLTPDTRVHVKAKLVEDVLTAIQVIVQNDGDDDEGGDDEDRPRKEYEGLVLSTTDAQLVMVDAHGQQVTFNIKPETTIRKGNTPVLLSEIQAGWRVHVRTAGTPALADGTFDALLVIVQNTNGDDDDDSGDDDDSLEVKFGGKIASVGGVELVVTTDGGDVTVQTDASTRIEKRGSSAVLADLAVGDKVKVEGVKVSDGVVLAREIEVKR